MNIESQEQTIELTRDAAKDKVELVEALERLQKNPDFQKVIMDEYMTNFPVQLVHSLAFPSMQDAEQQASIDHSLRGVGELNMFFSVLHNQAQMAQKAMEDADAELELIRQEAAEK